MAVAFADCSKEDEPGDYENTYDGVSIYLNAIQTLYDGEALPAFSSLGGGVYAMAASSESEAHDFIARLIDNPDWDGRSLSLPLGEKGECGSLKIVGGSEKLLQQGIYNKIFVDITGYTPYTLNILTEAEAKRQGI